MFLQIYYTDAGHHQSLLIFENVLWHLISLLHFRLVLISRPTCKAGTGITQFSSPSIENVCALFIVSVLNWVVQKGSKNAVTSRGRSECHWVSWVIKVRQQNFGRVQRKRRKTSPSLPQIEKKGKETDSNWCHAKGFECTHQVLGICLSRTRAGSTSNLCWVFTAESLARSDPSLCFPGSLIRTYYWREVICGCKRVLLSYMPRLYWISFGWATEDNCRQPWTYVRKRNAKRKLIWLHGPFFHQGNSRADSGLNQFSCFDK